MDETTAGGLQPGMYIFSLGKTELVITKLSNDYPENIKQKQIMQEDQKTPHCFEGNEIDSMSV